MSKIKGVIETLLVLSLALIAGAWVSVDSSASVQPSSAAQASAPARWSASERRTAGGSLTLGVSEDAEGYFPPTASWGPVEYWSAYALFDPLVMIGPNGSFHPYLAKSISANANFTKWTVKLRPGVKFHDGSLLTAQVLKQNFAMLTSDNLKQGEATQAGFLAGVSMKVVNNLTVVYQLKNGNAGFPTSLTTMIGTPFSMKAVKKYGKNAALHPVGTGPFEFVSWKRDDRLQVKKNPNYWQRSLPKVDEISFRVIPQEDTRLAGVQSGDLNAMFTSAPATASQCKQANDVKTYISGSDNDMFAITFNVNKAPLDDVRVRLALTHALDQDALIAVRGGTGILTPATQPFDKGSVWYSAAVARKFPAYDKNAATKLLTEYQNDPSRSDGKPAGAPVSFKYQYLKDPTTAQVQLAIMDMWQQIGAKVSNSPFKDDSAWLASVLGTFTGKTPYAGSFDVTPFAFEIGIQDPAIQLRTFFAEPLTGIVNISDHTSPAIEGGLRTLRSTGVLSKRRAAVARISGALATQVPHAYAGTTVTAVCARTDLTNVDSWVFPNGGKGSGSPLGLVFWSQVSIK